MDYNFHWRPVFKSLPDLLESALLTLEVAILSMILGILFGLALSLIRIKMTGPLKWFAVSWIELARNTPALLQLFFFGFGLGAFGIHFSPFLIVLLGLTFNNSGYLAENFEVDLTLFQIPKFRASLSLGMNNFQTYTRIIIPQVLRVVYHPMTNQMVWAVLMSSLGMLVGFRELSGETQFFASKTYRIFEYFAATAIIYYVIVKIILGLSRLMASRLFKY
jgi:polar amino acid transport system permease protein